jgi:hypothetical protein
VRDQRRKRGQANSMYTVVVDVGQTHGMNALVALGRQEDCECKASSGYKVTPHHKITAATPPECTMLLWFDCASNAGVGT